MGIKITGSMAAKIEQSPKNPIQLPEDVRIFGIPGLGVDGRVFSRLQPYIPQLELIEWLIPEDEEPMVEYARRMARPMLEWEGKSLLIGMSFGGIVAQEISRFHKLEGLILVSTMKQGDRRPWFFPLGEMFPIYQLFQGTWRYEILPLWAPFVGIPDKEDQILLQNMFMQSNNKHRNWGADQIVKWKGVPLSVPYIHIHGEEDRLFRSSDVFHADLVKKSGHFMIAQKPNEVAARIEQWLSSEIFSNSSA